MGTNMKPRLLMPTQKQYLGSIKMLNSPNVGCLSTITNHGYMLLLIFWLLALVVEMGVERLSVPLALRMVTLEVTCKRNHLVCNK